MLYGGAQKLAPERLQRSRALTRKLCRRFDSCNTSKGGFGGFFGEGEAVFPQACFGGGDGIAAPLLAAATNPLVPHTGMADPHVHVFNGTLYMYTPRRRRRATTTSFSGRF